MKALITAADLIRSNNSLQEGFGQRDVLSPQQEEVPQVNGHTNGFKAFSTVNVISGLLQLALAPTAVRAFDVRLAASECLKAYLSGHAAIRLYFLRRAIEVHRSDTRDPDNILMILMEDSEIPRATDPYRTWIAAILLFHLINEDFDAKQLAMSVAEGDADNGEEEITCIQALSASLISGELKDEDPRVSIGYLVVLCGWLYEDLDAVNDFLGEGSNVQSMVQLLTRSDQSRILVSGLCAFLLGIVYEFSTKDSPIPRATLHQILTTRLGREQYVDKITRLREHSAVRDFEVLHQGLHSAPPGALPEVYFDRTFVDFLKDNFSRIIRAIDRQPGLEVAVVANGIQKGISRELVDSLKAQVDAGAQKIQRLESDVLTLERKLGQEQADHRKAKDSAVADMNRIKSINQALQRNHEDDLQKNLQAHQHEQGESQKSHELAMRLLQSELHKARQESEADATRVRLRNDAEVKDLNAAIDQLRHRLEKASKEHVQDLQTAHEEFSIKTSALESRLARAEDKSNDAKTRAVKIEKDVSEKEAARMSAQTELDDLLMVLGDLEDKRARDKVRVTLLSVSETPNKYFSRNAS